MIDTIHCAPRGPGRTIPLILSPSRKRACVTRVRSQLAVSERRACQVVGQPRTTQRHQLKIRSDEKRLTAAIIRLAKRYGRYGYRRVTALLRAEGWKVNVKRVHSIWRREGLKVPMKQPKRGRLWLNDGSCVRLWPERPNHGVELRLRSRLHAGWPSLPDAHGHRRVHAPFNGDCRRTTSTFGRRAALPC